MRLAVSACLAALLASGSAWACPGKDAQKTAAQSPVTAPAVANEFPNLRTPETAVPREDNVTQPAGKKDDSDIS